MEESFDSDIEVSRASLSYQDPSSSKNFLRDLGAQGDEDSLAVNRTDFDDETTLGIASRPGWQKIDRHVEPPPTTLGRLPRKILRAVDRKHATD